MVKRQRASSSSLFLMELIIAILLFCLAASICVFAFAKSHLIHRDTNRLNNAIVLVGNTAEAIRAGDSQEEIASNLELLYPNFISGLKGTDRDKLLNQRLTIPIGNDYKETLYENSPYNLELECNNDKGLFCAIITFNVDNEPIFDLYVEHLIN